MKYKEGTKKVEISFSNPNEREGSLIFEDGKLRFEGDLKKSAKKFIDYINEQIGLSQ